MAGRILELGRRLRLWRVTAVAAGLVLAASVFAAVPGSVKVVTYSPLINGSATKPIPAWARLCLYRYPSLEKAQLAFCARVDGRVIGSESKTNGETHLLVAGGLHITLVELKPGSHIPGWGSRITAVGPLTSTHGIRELVAVQVNGT